MSHNKYLQGMVFLRGILNNMNWYKLSQQISKKLLKNIEKKKQISLQQGWTPEEVEWAGKISTQLINPSYFMWLLNQTRNGSANIQTGEDDEKIFMALDKFQKLKDKKMLSSEQSDINNDTGWTNKTVKVLDKYMNIVVL